MKCDKCGKDNAVIKIINEVDGVRKKIMLCKKCSLNIDEFILGKELNKEEFCDDIGISLNDLVKYINNDLTFDTVKKCPVCGVSSEVIKERGSIGCEECYKIFEEEIESLVDEIHGIKDNRQSKYKYLFGTKENIQSLEEELKLAIKTEEYEKACILRDLIKDIKGDVE